jgi:hsp70-interacting protein
MAFLVGTLVMQSDEKYEGELPNEVRNLVEESTKAGEIQESLVEGLKREGVLGGLVQGLKGDGEREGDLEFEENAVRALSKSAEKGGLSEAEKETVRGIWERWGSAGQAERGLEGEDAKEISRILA